jgi:hypothetical protein
MKIETEDLTIELEAELLKDDAAIERVEKLIELALAYRQNKVNIDLAASQAMSESGAEVVDITE